MDSALLPLSHFFGSGHTGPPVVRHWGHHIVSKVMNAFPGRAQQVPTASHAPPQPAAAVSQAASLAAAQPAAHPQQLQPASHLPAESHAGSAQIQAAPDFQPPAHLPAAPHAPAEHRDALMHQAVSAAGDDMPIQPAQKLPGQARALQGQGRESAHAPQAAVLSGSAHHSLQEAPGPETAMRPGRGDAALGTAPIPEVAVPAGDQVTAIPASQQQTQTPHYQQCTPSILQDLRHAAAAQAYGHQPQDSPFPSAGVSDHQAPMEPIQLSQPAFPELLSSQETTSIQAHRLNTASQSAGMFPPAPEVTGSTALAEHSDSISTAPVLEPAVTAAEHKQSVVRSQRLCEKKAAAVQAAAQAAADAVAQAGALRDQDILVTSVQQTGHGLASRTEVASSTVPLVLAECLASNRLKRVPGGDPMEVSHPSAPSSPLPAPPLALPSALPPAMLLPHLDLNVCITSACGPSLLAVQAILLTPERQLFCT